MVCFRVDCLIRSKGTDDVIESVCTENTDSAVPTHQIQIHSKHKVINNAKMISVRCDAMIPFKPLLSEMCVPVIRCACVFV